MIRAKVVILLALAVIVIGIVVFRAAVLHESTQDSPMTRQSPTGRPSSGQDTTTIEEDEAAGEVHSHEHLSSTTETARRQWAPVIDGFARNFTATNVSPGVWRTRLNAFSTVDVQRHLTSVDPAKVPAWPVHRFRGARVPGSSAGGEGDLRRGLGDGAVSRRRGQCLADSPL